MTGYARYLAGDAFDAEPLWELVVDGRANIYGTELRETAYEIVKATWPRSLALLELARLGPELGSDIGIITAMVIGKPGERQVVYLINVVDAENPEFIKRVHTYEGQVNSADLRADSELVTPDLTSRTFSVEG
jgi:hypothetical protein